MPITIDQLEEGQGLNRVTVNELFASAKAALAFGIRGSETSALTIEVYGGVVLIAGVATVVSNWSDTLTASATNYVYLSGLGVITRTTSAPSGWPSPLAAGAVPILDVTTDADGIIDGTLNDWRVSVATLHPFIPSTHTYAYAASVTVETNLYDVSEITLTGNVTLTFSGGVDGKSTLVRLRQDATGSRILTLGTGVRVGTDISTVTLSTTASKLDYLVVRYDGTATKYDVLAVVRGF